MSESDRICKQMKQAFEGEAWHGPSMLETLDGVGASTVAAKPIAKMHSIWEIVLHLIATQQLMLRGLVEYKICAIDGTWSDLRVSR